MRILSLGSGCARADSLGVFPPQDLKFRIKRVGSAISEPGQPVENMVEINQLTFISSD